MIKQMENKRGEKTGEMEWNNLEMFAFRILHDASSDAFEIVFAKIWTRRLSR